MQLAKGTCLYNLLCLYMSYVYGDIWMCLIEKSEPIYSIVFIHELCIRWYLVVFLFLSCPSLLYEGMNDGTWYRCWPAGRRSPVPTFWPFSTSAATRWTPKSGMEIQKSLTTLIFFSVLSLAPNFCINHKRVPTAGVRYLSLFFYLTSVLLSASR